MADSLNFPSDGSGSPITEPESGRTWGWDGQKWVLLAIKGDYDFKADYPLKLAHGPQVADDEIRYQFDISTLDPLNS